MESEMIVESVVSLPEQERVDSQEERLDRRERLQRMGDDEQKRGQRFFGTLMGTLGKFQKESVFLQEKNAKRAEIEARLAECMRKEKEEVEERVRIEKDEKQRAAERIRKASLREFEKLSLETYYKNKIASARALKTTTLPVLFYQPWKLSSKEEERAKFRVEELERKYQQELKELEERLSCEDSVYIKEVDVSMSTQETCEINVDTG
ncbi:hypothetical protein T552_01175 [Pneumocystis carinii B80]|uniref:Pinin/SDK/MemA protein domain-containing protein n=1 Tax=Pneumocystis carinii (strain B80) TaxID=1408658 RepID=A0A0W4ZLI7_PNEC8|nr:hypothetical protein T552_01175 [Pneumocystis carinii B80]KTW29219.1 hypothetical protein T552_01175 [Pneumocystis carinii B80]